MDLRLELVPMPVTDVDGAKAFHADKVGFNVDLDERFANGMRVVQLTYFKDPDGNSWALQQLPS